MLARDGYNATVNGQQGVVFISTEQAQAYGGYVGVAAAFPGCTILPPNYMADYWGAEFATVREVGHA